MFRKYIKPFWWVLKIEWRAARSSFLWNVFYSVYSGIEPLFSTFAVAKLIASVSAVALGDGTQEPVYLWLLVLMVIELLRQVTGQVNSVLRVKLQYAMNLEVAEQFFSKMYALSQEQFDDQKFNTKLDRSRDALTQMWRILDDLSYTFSSFLRFVGAILAIAFAAPYIALLIIVTTIPSSILHIRHNKRREEAYEETEPFDRIAYRSRWLLIDPSMMPEIRLMNAFNKLIVIWHRYTKKAQDVFMKYEKKLAVQESIAETLAPIVYFAANVYFFRLVVSGAIGLDRFIFLRGVLSEANSSALSFSNSIQSLHELSINLQNFQEVNATTPTIPKGHIAVKAPLTIEFKDVSFHYPGSKELSLDKVSFLIVPGSKLALVGENGAGKSTLIKLLLRQYLPTSGQILVNGNDIKDIDQVSYYAAISNLSQEFMMVNHITIEENLTIGIDWTPTKDQIYETTDLVDATSFIKKLPHKLKTRLDKSFDDGTNLSGGQTQRLGVARALLRKGDIMILDEPTSAIDAKAEFNIFNNIYKAHAGKTTLIVSHRFSTVRKADQIIVMEAGKITEYGSHAELLKHNGLYKEMFDTQAEGYK